MRKMLVEDLKQFGIDAPKEGKLIIDTFTEWCAPCKYISPVLEKFRDDGLINLVQVDLDKNREIGQKLNITAVPTLFFFKDGKLLDNDIKIQGEVVVSNGVMIGAAGELILKEIIEQM